jgi:hypothetical protein
VTTWSGREQSNPLVDRPDHKEETVPMMRQNPAERMVVTGGSGFFNFFHNAPGGRPMSIASA